MSIHLPTPNHYRTQNFEGTDLRGKPFIGTWQHAIFRQVTTGPPSILQSFHQVCAIFLAILAGFTTAYAVGSFLVLFYPITVDPNCNPGTDPAPSLWLLGIFIGIGIVIFWGVTLWKGLTYTLGLISFIAIFIIVVTVAISTSEVAGGLAISMLAIGGSIAGIVGLAAAIVLTQVLYRHIVFSILGLVIGFLFTVTTVDGVWLFPISILILGLGCYMGKRALHSKLDSRYKILQTLAIIFATYGSTRFREADLTSADFSNATLRHTDFSNAILTRTRWYHATFHQNNLQGTYLADPKIRRLVTELDGQEQNFDRLDLRGVNLDHANLAGASFIGADLTNATLQGANLTNAKLAQAQLYGADLTGAILTGAYIENWGISPETHLDAIQCDYIHLRLPTNDNPDPYRKPDNRDEVFQANDFTDFIAPILNTLKAYRQQALPQIPDAVPFKTLDLYHREGIDSTAAAIALQELINQNAQAQIQILTIEGVDQKIRIQASIAAPADPSPLNTHYFQRYNRLVTQPRTNLQALFETLANQHTQLRFLEARIADATDSPLSYIEVSPNTDTAPRRLALQRKRDRLNRAIDQQNQHLDNWETELQALNNQWAIEGNEASRVRLQRQMTQLEDQLVAGEEKLTELEKQLSDI